MTYHDKHVEVTDLVGKTLKSIERTDGDEMLVFTTTDDVVYKMYHEQDCCESVTIEDICGDLQDLVGEPILMAEEATSDGNPKKHGNDGEFQWEDESSTWTFYKFATRKGYVDIRWYGTSNGYYSESVSFVRV